LFKQHLIPDKKQQHLGLFFIKTQRNYKNNKEIPFAGTTHNFTYSLCFNSLSSLWTTLTTRRARSIPLEMH